MLSTTSNEFSSSSSRSDHIHTTNSSNSSDHQIITIHDRPFIPLDSHPPPTTKMTESIPLRSSPHSEHQQFLTDEEQHGMTATNHNSKGTAQIDIKNRRYPFCLVWGPLPLISWIFPWIGHLGIGDSEGKVHDFAGPYFIGIDDFMTPIFKYYQFPKEIWSGKESAWDMGILQSDAEYRKTMHNICCNNCHHHSARALVNMNLHPDLASQDMLGAWWLVTRKGKFINTGAWLCTYMPAIIGVAFILFIALWMTK